MTISLQYCHITVNDLDESLAFYRDALGLEVRNDVASGGFRWVTLGSTSSRTLRSSSPSRTPADPKPTETPCRNCSPRESCR